MAGRSGCCELAALVCVAVPIGLGCGDDAAGGDDPCAQGICASNQDADQQGGTGGGAAGAGDGSAGGAAGSTGGAGAGAGGDGTGGAAGQGGSGGDAAGNGGAGGAGAGGSGGGDPGSCVESWLCTPWETSGSNDATRTCTDDNACGTTAAKPTETATLPALDLDDYKCNVEPILDRGCAQLACHGTEEGRALRTYARGRLRITGDSLPKANLCLKPASEPPEPSENCTGSVECWCWMHPHTANEWQRNFDSARGFALDSSGNPLADMSASELLTQPLAGSGFNHAGIKMFQQGDPDYTRILNWLEGTSQGCADSALLQN